MVTLGFDHFELKSVDLGEWHLSVLNTHTDVLWILLTQFPLL